MPPKRRATLEGPIWSLRRRLLAWLLIATAVMGIVALFDTWLEAKRTANDLADRVLAGAAAVISERAALNAEGVLDIAVPYGALEMLSSAAQDRVFYRVDTFGPEARLITGYADLPTSPAKVGGPPVFRDAEYRGATLRLASLSRAVSTGIDEVPFTVTMAETTLAREALSRDILLRSALRLLGMILGAALIVWIAVTLSLRPLARLGEAIAARSPDDLRPVETAVPSEVRALVTAVNSLMQRLGQALEGLRNFTGNAGHQLRTPLTVIRTQLALAGRAESLDVAKAASREADAALGRAERVLSQLLALARVDAAEGLGKMEVVDLAPLLRDLTAEHIPAAAERSVDLGFEIGDGPSPQPARHFAARIDPLLFGEAVHNLISNAILHGGAGAMVTLRLSRAADHLVIEVEDNGPGIPTEARESVLRRFERRASDQSTGMGLGLPVVQEITRLFHGSLSLNDAPRGRGLLVRLTLPVAERTEGHEAPI